jgi:hypothetical protein
VIPSSYLICIHLYYLGYIHKSLAWSWSRLLVLFWSALLYCMAHTSSRWISTLIPGAEDMLLRLFSHLDYHHVSGQSWSLTVLLYYCWIFFISLLIPGVPQVISMFLL